MAKMKDEGIIIAYADGFCPRLNFTPAVTVRHQEIRKFRMEPLTVFTTEATKEKVFYLA